jgi:hypothetical protein
MVCTRKKDYGEPPSKKRKQVTSSRQQSTPAHEDVVEIRDEPKAKHIGSQDSCTEFTLFPLLPTELRFMIWEDCINLKPQLVLVKPKPVKKHEMKRPAQLPRAVMSYPVLQLLSVNKESRDYVVRHYTLRFLPQNSMTYRLSNGRNTQLGYSLSQLENPDQSLTSTLM